MGSDSSNKGCVQQKDIVGETEVGSSPACSAHEMDDRYAGYAGREELLAFFNELVEAERAGARIAAHTRGEASDPALIALMGEIHRDESHWCSVLLKWIANLGGSASARTGAFYEKCLAIQDISERVAFINRGQGWVVRKLREMLPRMRDDAMHADFMAMLKGHEENIAKAARFKPSAPD